MNEQSSQLLHRAAAQLREHAAMLELGDVLMHPGVGLTLADWLEAAAKRQQATEQDAVHAWRGSSDTEARDRWVASRTDHRALAVGRLLLGSEADNHG